MSQNKGEVFMRELLYGITEMIARIHNYIMHVNDRFEYDFSDKDLHFLVIGILGMLMILLCIRCLNGLPARSMLW